MDMLWEVPGHLAVTCKRTLRKVLGAYVEVTAKDKNNNFLHFSVLHTYMYIFREGVVSGGEGKELLLIQNKITD